MFSACWSCAETGRMKLTEYLLDAIRICGGGFGFCSLSPNRPLRCFCAAGGNLTDKVGGIAESVTVPGSAAAGDEKSGIAGYRVRDVWTLYLFFVSSLRKSAAGDAWLVEAWLGTCQ